MKASKLFAVILLSLLPGVAHAASITNSVIVEDRAQRDGRRWIRERHTDNAGVTHDIVYMAEEGANATTAMTARVATIVSQLETGEVDSIMARATSDAPFAAPNLTYATAAQLRTRLREAYRTLSGWQAVCLGHYINSLGLSDAQLTAIFGVSGAQLTALKTKLSNATTRFNQVTSEAGQ